MSGNQSAETGIKTVFQEQVTDHMIGQFTAFGVLLSCYLEDYEEADGTFRNIINLIDRMHELKGNPMQDSYKAELRKHFLDIRDIHKLSMDSILDLEII